MLLQSGSLHRFHKNLVGQDGAVSCRLAAARGWPELNERQDVQPGVINMVLVAVEVMLVAGDC